MKIHLDKSEWAEHAFEDGHKIESCFDSYCCDDDQSQLMMRSALFWDIMQCRVVIPYQHFGTVYQSHLRR